jgi:hypothetical protein
LGNGHLASFRERIRRVAVGAAEVAGGEAHKDTRQAGEGAFALQAEEDFVDDQRVAHGDNFVEAEKPDNVESEWYSRMDAKAQTAKQ